MNKMIAVGLCCLGTEWVLRGTLIFDDQMSRTTIHILYHLMWLLAYIAAVCGFIGIWWPTKK